jgi:hypothetical protein
MIGHSLYGTPTSGTPPTRVDTTRRPQAAASTMAIQKASVKEAFRNIWPCNCRRKEEQHTQGCCKQPTRAAQRRVTSFHTGIRLILWLNIKTTLLVYRSPKTLLPLRMGQAPVKRPALRGCSRQAQPLAEQTWDRHLLQCKHCHICLLFKTLT